MAALRRDGIPEPTRAAHAIIRRIEAELGHPDASGRAGDIIRRMVAIDTFAQATAQADALPAAGRDARLAAIATELMGRIPAARADLEHALEVATAARPTPSRQQPAPGPDRPRGPRSGEGRGGR